MLLAVGTTLGTALLLRRWDRPQVSANSRPWWFTWQRTALLAVLVFGFGALGPLSGHVGRGMLPMYVVTFSMLPLFYNLLGIGVAAYRVEQLMLWPTWTLGAVTAGGNPWHATLLALGILSLCMTFGAGQLRGWHRIWRRWHRNA